MSATALDGPAITASDDTAQLSEMAWEAALTARRLVAAAQALAGTAKRVGCPEDAERAFAALRAFETARNDTDRMAGAVISHAVTRHGYY